MELQSIISQKILEELEKDPQNVGYKGKTDDEIVALLNSNVVIEKLVTEILPTPISRILAGIASAPNIITKGDLTIARNSIL